MPYPVSGLFCSLVLIILQDLFPDMNAHFARRLQAWSPAGFRIWPFSGFSGIGCFSYEKRTTPWKFTHKLRKTHRRLDFQTHENGRPDIRIWPFSSGKRKICHCRAACLLKGISGSDGGLTFRELWSVSLMKQALSSPRPWVGLIVFRSKQEVSEAAGSP